jgi:polyphenol oxidase
MGQKMAIVRVLTGQPQWDRRVRILHSTRTGGVSQGAWSSLNLGAHVNDDPDHVRENRVRFTSELPQEPCWLNQVHGIDVCNLDIPHAQFPPSADAAFTATANRVVCIQTADCLPVVLVDAQGKKVGAAHAGWRGLCSGVIENLASSMGGTLEGGFAWLGPAIGPAHFEVGSEVKQQFMVAAQPRQCEQTDAAFTGCEAQSAAHPPKYLADLYALARLRLSNLGIGFIMGGERCTYREKDEFFSFRRDGQTGRMASCVWMVNEE